MHLENKMLYLMLIDSDTRRSATMNTVYTAHAVATTGYTFMLATSSL